MLFLLAAQNIPIPAPNPVRLQAPSRQRDEARILRLAVESLHPDPARFLGAKGMAAKGRELEREAEFAGDTATWYRAVSRYLAHFGDATLTAEWPEAVVTFRRENPTHLPFRVEFRGGKAVVIGAVEGSGVAVGDEVREIEGRRIGDIRQEISRWSSVDARNGGAKEARLGEDLDRFGPILWGLRSTFRVRLAKGDVKEVRAVPSAAWEALGPKPAFAIDRLSGQIAHVRVDALTGLAEETLAPLRRDVPRRVILDLRRANGLAEESAMRLVRALAPQPPAWSPETWARPLAVPDALRPYLRDGATLDVKVNDLPDGRVALDLPPAPTALEGAFAGPLDILVGPGTGSAAVHLVARLRSTRPLRVIGEPPGGVLGATLDGPFRSLALPHSGITVRIPVFRTEAGEKARTLSLDVRTRGDALEWAIKNPPKG